MNNLPENVIGPIAPIADDYRYTLSQMIAETTGGFVGRLTLKERKKLLKAKLNERNNNKRKLRRPVKDHVTEEPTPFQ